MTLLARIGGLTRDLFRTVLVAALLACFARAFLLQAFRIPSVSMTPGLVVGDHLLVNKFVFGPTVGDWERRWLPIRSPRRSDVVVFRYPMAPDRDFVKRVVALPGDRLRIRDKRVIVDGVELDEADRVTFSDERTYPDVPLLDERFRRRDNFGPVEVPAGGLFVLGDNRDRSSDSRYWGPVPRHFVKGLAVARLWSIEPPTGTSESLLARFRWARSFEIVR